MHPHPSSHQAPSPLTFPAYTPMVLTHFHNRFIPSNRWHGITHAGEVSSYNPDLLRVGLARRVQGALLAPTMVFIPDVWVVIGYRWVKFCPPLMSLNMARAARLLENKLTNGAALTDYRVHGSLLVLCRYSNPTVKISYFGSRYKNLTCLDSNIKKLM